MLASQQNAVSDLIREEMAQGTSLCFRVISGSMVPLIAAGDEIEVEQAGADRLRRGDIVLYTVGGAFHTHRLLARRRHGSATLLVTKGDTSLNPDQPWREEQLLGKVVAIKRRDRTIGPGGWKVEGDEPPARHPRGPAGGRLPSGSPGEGGHHRAMS